MSNVSYESGLLFIRAYKQVRSSIYEILEPYGLNPSYWSIIGAVMASPDGIRLSSVAAIMDVKAPLVTMLGNDLIDMGLIDRLPHHTDKRVKLLVMTPRGKKLAGEIETKLTGEINRLVDGLTEPEIETFQKALQTIINNVN